MATAEKENIASVLLQGSANQQLILKYYQISIYDKITDKFLEDFETCVVSSSELNSIIWHTISDMKMHINELRIVKTRLYQKDILKFTFYDFSLSEEDAKVFLNKYAYGFNKNKLAPIYFENLWSYDVDNKEELKEMLNLLKSALTVVGMQRSFITACNSTIKLKINFDGPKR